MPEDRRPMGDLYEECHDAGGMSLYAYEDDPRRLAFTLARYKHTAKLLEGYNTVLEVGCADGFGSRIVRQHVASLTAIDVDGRSIEEARLRNSATWQIDFYRADICDPETMDPSGGYDAIYALDVLEHISPDDEFLRALRGAAPVAVIGTPSLESQTYASRLSREGHVNCYSGPDLKRRLLRYWNHVFLLTMNDESLGTGFPHMAQYLLALCVGLPNGK